MDVGQAYLDLLNKIQAAERLVSIELDSFRSGEFDEEKAQLYEAFNHLNTSIQSSIDRITPKKTLIPIPKSDPPTPGNQ